MNVHDIFLYNGERDLLEIRLNVLKDVVNYFVIIESPLTFTGLEKPIYYKPEDFPEFNDRIYHIIGPKAHSDFLWANEWASRNLGLIHLSVCEDEDVILLSDVDEIPNPITLKDSLPFIDSPVTFNQIYNFYKLNLRCFTLKDWPGTIAAKAKHVSRIHSNDFNYFFTKEFGFQALREGRATYPKISFGGNHYSYVNDIAGIQNKLKSFCHAPELARFNNPEHIKACIEKGESIWVESDGNRLEKFDLDTTNTPSYILNNIDKYRHLIL